MVTLPANSVTLTGIGTDVDGTIVSYTWLKFSGPSTGGTIATPNASTTVINNLVQGIYQYTLTVKDNSGATAKDTVLILVNAPPVADAGADQMTTLPVNSVYLTGTGTDVDGPITKYNWAKISGPTSGSIVSASTAGTQLINLSEGVYQYELTVTDYRGAISKDAVVVTVNRAPNQLPNATAGDDNTITLPLNTTILNGNGNDADGTIVSYSWAKISGPSSGTIATPDVATTALNDLTEGVYQYELTITDNDGGTAKDVVQITVNPAPNVAPVADAGTDNTITLPVNTVTLTGNVQIQMALW